MLHFYILANSPEILSTNRLHIYLSLLNLPETSIAHTKNTSIYY